MCHEKKLSTKSSTEAELVGMADTSSLILWTNIFLEAQGYNTKQISYINIIKVLCY